MLQARILGPLLLTLTLAGTAAARPPGCSEQCDLTTDPSTTEDIVCTCWERAGAPVITCGEYWENHCGLYVAPPEDEQVMTEEADASFEPGDEQASRMSEVNVCQAAS